MNNLNKVGRVIWDIVNPLKPIVDSTLMKQLAESLLTEDIPELNAFPLNDLYLDPSGFNLNKMRSSVASNWNKYLLPEQLVLLTAYLVKEKVISQNRGANILSAISNDLRKELPRETQDLIEIADLVVEDRNEGFKKVEEDNIFLNALNKFLEIGDGNTGRS